MNLNDLQREVGQWGKETFPHSSIATITEHLRREAVELQQNIERWQVQQKPVKDDVVWPTTIQEVTGIILLTLHIAHRKGFSFADVLRGSFEEVKTRKWGEPDADGVVEHICDCCGERPCKRAEKAEADAHREIYERGYRVGIELSAKLCDAAGSWKILPGESVSGGMSHTLQAIQYLGISIRALLTEPATTTDEGTTP
jgi:hypothetical protein